MAKNLEHLGGMNSLSELEGIYFKSDDGSLVVVDKTGQVKIDEQNYRIKVVTQDGVSVFTLGDYAMTTKHSNGNLDWVDRVCKSLITWQRMPEKESVAILRLIAKTAPPPPPVPTIPTTPPHSTKLTSKLKSLRELILPSLKDPDFLLHHLSTIESLAMSLGIMDDNGEIADSAMQVPFVLKVIVSFEHPAIRKTAQEVCSSIGHDWTRIKEVLKRRYARKDILKASYHRRLAELEFPGIQEFESFLTKGSSVMHLLRQLFADADDSSERRVAVRLILARLPESIRKECINKIFAITGVDNWETLLPFDDLDDTALYSTTMNNATIIEIMRQCCSAHLEVGYLNSMNAQPFGATNKATDKIRYVSPPYSPVGQGSHGSTKANEPTEERRTLNAWASAAPYAIVLSGKLCEQHEEVEKTLKQLDVTGYRMLRNKQTNRPYFVVTLSHTGKQAEMEAAFPGLVVKKFDTSYPKRSSKNFLEGSA